MHALILMTVLAQWAPREAPHYGHVRESRRMGNRSLVGQGYAFFEFAPASGVGMPSACSTTAPTGAKGEVLTFARNGNATCSKKGLATTGIADGDLVVLSSNVARVEPDADGVLGLRVEGPRTNGAIRSEEFDNAAWTKASSGSGSVPTVTANAGVAPDGTTTAERIQFSACAGAPSSSEVQRNTGVGSAVSSLYVKGYNGSSGTIRLCQYSTGNCATVAYTGSSWQRAVTTQGGAGGTYVVFGCLNNAIYSGFSDTGAADVLVWGAQHEAGAYATSYIPTVAAAVTRNADDGQYIAALGTALASGSAAATVTLPSTSYSVQVGLLSLNSNSTTIRTGFFVGAADFARGLVAGAVPGGLADIALTTGSNRLLFSWSATQTSLANNASSDTGAGATETASIDRVRFCDWAGGSFARQCNGIISRVCVDPDPRCRP